MVSGCGGVIRKPRGRITSPDYPNVYPNNVECIWYVVAPLGSRIELNVLEYDLEGEADCQFDSLLVYGGPDLTSPRLTQLCQRRTANVTVTSTGNNMVVKFVSDGSIRGKGFAAEFKTLTGGETIFAYSFKESTIESHFRLRWSHERQVGRHRLPRGCHER